jgi:amino acid adenylation domain-containing protein
VSNALPKARDAPATTPMGDSSKIIVERPPEQEAIKDKCVHPTGSFVEFSKEEVEQSIPDRFEKIVRQYPDRIAVKTRDEVVTYSELNAMANRLARAILGRRNTSAEPVGILADQSVPLMAAMLGVLKAGKFFVLLDPLFPQSRLTAMLSDSQAELLVADKKNALSARGLANSGPQLLGFESIGEKVLSDNLALPLSPDLLAYIAYTSGSTGQPKGVVNIHRNLLHDTMLRTNAYHICNQDNLSLLGSTTTHAIKNALYALLNGAMLVPFDVQREGVIRLASWLSREKISICRISVALFRKFCETLTGKDRFDDLRLIQFAGDTRFISDVDLWKRYFPPGCLLANGFSSSETGYLTDYLIDHETDVGCREMPAGYSVDDKKVFLLDDSGKAVGWNEVGEIAVKSAYLAPGYWCRPALTEARFKPGPNGDQERIYLTGDLGLLLPDGCLVYRGRKDFRVKVRGYSVEIAEVENALLNHPIVKEAGVVAWNGENEEKYLAAYIVPRKKLVPTVDELRRFLAEKLPDFMIPSAFMFLESLPVTNGKLDRKALPKPDDKRPHLSQPYVIPRNEVEQKLVYIWEAALDARPIGIHDDFFDLGGHSLLAMRIISKVIETFGVEVSIRSLLDAPTVARLAGVIESLWGSKENAEQDLSGSARAEETGEI